MELWIDILDILDMAAAYAYCFCFFWILAHFIPLRRPLIVKVLAYAGVCMFAETVIYLNDPSNMLASLALFTVYAAVFHQGDMVKKAAMVMIFYPVMISVNFVFYNSSSRFFFWLTNAPAEPGPGWTDEMWFISSLLFFLFQAARLIFWIIVWFGFGKRLKDMTRHLTRQMWMVTDILLMILPVAEFTAIYFVQDKEYVVYPLCIAAVAASFGCICLTAYLNRAAIVSEEAAKLEAQKEYYMDKLREEERVRSMYHDMKNHLLVLEGSQGTDTARQMAQELRSQIADYENYVHTGNDFLDILIRDKAKKACEKQIDFSAFIDFRDADFIDPLDISTFFGNGIDNAIEASEKMPEEERVILIKAGKVQNFVSILIENNCMPDSGMGDHRTTKADKFLHGFGISNMKKAAEKYAGTCTTTQTDGKFTLKILLPISKI